MILRLTVFARIILIGLVLFSFKEAQTQVCSINSVPDRPYYFNNNPGLQQMYDSLRNDIYSDLSALLIMIGQLPEHRTEYIFSFDSSGVGIAREYYNERLMNKHKISKELCDPRNFPRPGQVEYLEGDCQSSHHLTGYVFIFSKRDSISISFENRDIRFLNNILLNPQYTYLFQMIDILLEIYPQNRKLIF